MRKKSLRAMKSAVFQAPESRAEAIMQNILGANNVLVPPEAPFEEILQAILYNTPYTKEAEARIEEILLAIKNNGTYDGEPQSRDEEILISKLNQTPYTKDAESRIEELFILWAAQSIVKQLEGVPPLTFTAIGNPLISWSIYGNMQQTGTPSSSTPITPSECGERTANLIDIEDISETVTVIYKDKFLMQSISEGTYTLSFNTTADVSHMVSVGVGATGYSKDIKTISGVQNGYYTIDFTISAEDSGKNLYVRFVRFGAVTTVAYTVSNIMLNTGSTAFPYEPYGFKLPVQCGGVTTPVYLKEPIRKIGDYADYKSNAVEYRVIKKVVLTGEENWVAHAIQSNLYTLAVTDYLFSNTMASICSHYTTQVVASAASVPDKKLAFYYNANSPTTRLMYIKDTDFAALTDLKTYLQQQYAAGTPVCVWYVLATPTTTTVQAPEIPTVNGSNTFDVDTSLKPSNVYIEYQ